MLFIVFLSSHLLGTFWGFVAFLWQTEVHFHLVKVLAKFLCGVNISPRVMFCIIKWLSESKFVSAAWGHR